MEAPIHIPIDPALKKDVTLCAVDDQSERLDCILKGLANAGYASVGTASPDEALRRIGKGEFRASVVDSSLRQMDAIAFLEKALDADPGVSVFFLNASEKTEAATEAIIKGARDSLSIRDDFATLIGKLDELAVLIGQRRETRELDEKLLSKLRFQGMVGRTPAMFEVFDLARKFAPHITSVLINGPAGSGKELLARAIHDLSPVAKGRFVSCDCSTLGESAIWAYLTGHFEEPRDAARSDHPATSASADRGTVYLGEICDLSMHGQARLLRLLHGRELDRSNFPEAKRVRLIAASSRDLSHEARSGRFRKDLLDLLQIFEIRMPALNQNRQEIPLLARHFLLKYGNAHGKKIHGLTRRAQAALESYDWPGNVGELENTISSAVLSVDSDFIDIRHLPARLQGQSQRADSLSHDNAVLSIDEVRAVHIERVLAMCDGNRVRAAQLLGIGRTSLYRFLKEKEKV